MDVVGEPPEPEETGGAEPPSPTSSRPVLRGAVYNGGQFAYKSVIHLERAASVWAPPIWPLKTALPVAGLLMLLQATSNLIKDLYFAVTGKTWAEREVNV